MLLSSTNLYPSSLQSSGLWYPPALINSLNCSLVTVYSPSQKAPNETVLMGDSSGASEPSLAAPPFTKTAVMLELPSLSIGQDCFIRTCFYLIWFRLPIRKAMPVLGVEELSDFRWQLAIVAGALEYGEGNLEGRHSDEDIEPGSNSRGFGCQTDIGLARDNIQSRARVGSGWLYHCL